jgi:hypothetical protein
MSENSCTTPHARLDSLRRDAAKALRGARAHAFGGKKISAYISPKSDFDGTRGRVDERESRESAPTDSQTRVLGSIWQAT